MSFSVAYNSLTLQPGNDIYVTSMDGIDGLPFRTSEVNYITRDGGNVFNTLTEMRVIGLNGVVRGQTASQYFTNKRSLVSTFAKQSDYQTLTITLWDGTVRTLDVKPSLAPLIVERPGETTIADFRVELKAGIPYFKDTTTQSSTVTLAIPVGFDIPFSIPFDIEGSSDNILVINNEGDVAWYPEIVIQANNDLTTARITNQTTGEYFRIDTTIPSGSFVRVKYDENGIYVKLNDVTDYFQYFDGDLFKLATGNNTIAFTASSSDSVSTATVSYVNRYLSA